MVELLSGCANFFGDTGAFSGATATGAVGFSELTIIFKPVKKIIGIEDGSEKVFIR